MLLKDKVSIITGGARGIGKQLALTFAREGSHLVICDVNEGMLSETEAQLTSLGIEVLALKVDVTNALATEEMVNKTLDKFKRVDILINNAGITRDALLMRMKENDWDAVLSINLKGAFNCTKAVSQVMLKQRSGSIINISSIIGIIGNAGQSNYAASKAGLIGFTKSIAKELAPRGVTVNAIAPGFIQTDMTAALSEEIKMQMLALIPLGKFGTSQDVANVALFLASENARYITGQVIRIDGGMAM
ncbi:MAG: 3-oxoacyl-[acyl-carrier-protein] reductase [Candidatus Omnitrophota bacterium]